MLRDRDEIRRRLQAAALELYRTAGYDCTAADEIARRAGVTERTFFRHFADKREVLFGAEPELAHLINSALCVGPADPWPAMLHAFKVTEPFFVENRLFIIQRMRIVATALPLQERELAKVKALTLVVVNGLEARGTARRTADLAAAVGVAAFTAALALWLEDDSVGLAERVATSFAAISILTATSSP